MSDIGGDDHVRLDHDLPVLLDRLDVSLETAPAAPGFASISDGDGDAALLLLVTETGRAVQALASQIEIIRNEMRLTMLTAMAADNYTSIETVAVLPTED